jgi:hypothetical protein
MPPNFDPNDRLLEANPTPLGQRVPEPLHERVEQLCDLAYEAGEPRRPTKQQMVGALLFGAPTDAEELVALLRRYGRATVADALLQVDTPAGSVIELPTRKSGPRSPRRR